MTHVLVAGGGPVGLATAIEARLAGFEATVVEPRSGVIDKACGEGLMPGALPALARLGVDPRGFPLLGVQYRDARRAVTHRFRRGSALGVRRLELHGALRARAAELGVRTTLGRVESVVQDADGVEAAGIRADWLIAADGLHSTVAGLVGLDRGAPTARRRYGQRRHYDLAPWTDLIEVHWTPLGELYVTPTADDGIGIALLARRGVRFDDALAAVPGLAARVDGAAPRSELRGAGPFRQRRRSRVAGRVLLVGDASGYVDALTGEGIRIGLAQARVAIAALAAGDPGSYERAWRRVTREFRMLTAPLAALAASPAQPLVVPLARTAPFLFHGAVERIAR
ncbi:NAD(P)/FAD-dependent oxidoreductase [Pseudolysinimonas sp.]|uniref:NAD(P)/FAD-dependent oxidoreductase n=1 Tax=Pseudolysinimonas sp. TaxID=2680009 RepID=UPI003F7D6EE7